MNLRNEAKAWLSANCDSEDYYKMQGLVYDLAEHLEETIHNALIDMATQFTEDASPSTESGITQQVEALAKKDVIDLLLDEDIIS